MAKLSTKARNKLDKKSFAFPKEGKEPLENASHVRNAVARFNQVIPATTYLSKAGASDLFESQSGMVMSTSRNRAVKSFATMMVRDHAQSR